MFRAAGGGPGPARLVAGAAPLLVKRRTGERAGWRGGEGGERERERRGQGEEG